MVGMRDVSFPIKWTVVHAVVPMGEIPSPRMRVPSGRRQYCPRQHHSCEQQVQTGFRQIFGYQVLHLN